MRSARGTRPHQWASIRWLGDESGDEDVPYTHSLLRSLIVAGVLIAPVAAIAQNAVPVRSSTGAAAFVNGAVISNYDLDQRTALFAATSGLRPTEENLAQIRPQVLRSL